MFREAGRHGLPSGPERESRGFALRIVIPASEPGPRAAGALPFNLAAKLEGTDVYWRLNTARFE